MSAILEPAGGYAPYRLIFQTPGLIDMLGVKTFGISAKPYANPIGYFGTGLKYAIAIALRGHAKLTILRGLERFDFTTHSVTSRERIFSQVFCNDEPMAFTLDLGRDWEPWMALRELYCNTVDERGTLLAQEQEPFAEEGITKIILASETFGRLWRDERHTFILESTPIATSSYCDVHAGETKHLYYNGIRAYTSEKPFLYTYNIKSPLTLTEDRSIAWIWQAQDYLYRGLLSLSNSSILRTLFRYGSKDVNQELYAEFDFRYPPDYEASREALDIIRELHDAKELRGSCGLEDYFAKDELCRLGDDDYQPSESEIATIARVNEFLPRLGLSNPFRRLVVSSKLNMQQTWHVAHKSMGFGLELQGNTLPICLNPANDTLFIARAVVMQGVRETLRVLIEAQQEKSSNGKKELQAAFLEAFIGACTFDSYFSIKPLNASPEPDEEILF